jgi:hypothetical protein
MVEYLDYESAVDADCFSLCVVAFVVLLVNGIFDCYEVGLAVGVL